MPTQCDEIAVLLPEAVDAAEPVALPVRRHIESIRALLDHQFLDEVPELGPATLENLCTFIFTKLVARCPQLVAVSVERQASGDKCVLRKERKADATSGSDSVGTATRSALPA